MCARLLQLCRFFAIVWTVSPARLLCPWDSPGMNTGVGCHALLQGFFPAQGWNLMALMPSALAGGYLLLVPPGKPPIKSDSYHISG